MAIKLNTSKALAKINVVHADITMYIKNYTPKKLCAFSAWTEELKLHKLHKVIQINKKLYLHILWWSIRSNKYRWFKLKSTFWRESNSRKCGLKMWLVCLPVSRSVQGQKLIYKNKNTNKLQLHLFSMLIQCQIK